MEFDCTWLPRSSTPLTLFQIKLPHFAILYILVKFPLVHFLEELSPAANLAN
jgi:hypothetical protein